MAARYRILLFIAPLVFILDQLSKRAVVAFLPLGERLPVIPGFFDLVHFQNTGAAFGLFATLPPTIRAPFFYVVALVAVVVLFFIVRSLRPGEHLVAVAIALVFGGIAGNIVDRVRIGAVTDFLSFHIGRVVLEGDMLGVHYRWPLEWPAFNLADSALTVGMILLAISLFSGGRKASTRARG